MELTEMREKIHSLIDTAPEDKLQKIYELLEDDEEYTDEFKAELDAAYEDYQRNGNTVSKEDVYLTIDKLMGRRK